jgi:hypothetical protein
MYGIEKKYGVSGEDLRANPFIEEEALHWTNPRYSGKKTK